MKKTVLLMMLCAMLLAGCGKQTKAVSDGRHFAVMRENMKIALDAPAAPVLSVLGAPFGYAESKSGSHDGVEKTYRFRGLNLRTYQGEDGDRIMGFLFTDSSLQTEEGISLGSSADEVRQCYGTDAIRDNCCVLSRSNEKLMLVLKNNVVTAIQYSLL